MADNRKTQGITKPIYEMKKVKRSGKTKYKQVSEQRGRRLMEKGAKNNPAQSFDTDSQEYDINKSKSITRYGGPSQYMGAKIGQMLSEISTGSNDAWLKAMDQSGISPVKNKITLSPLIEANGEHDIPAGEQGGYSTEPAQHYDESVSTPVKEMGNVDIKDIHTIADDEPPQLPVTMKITPTTENQGMTQMSWKPINK